jgi:1-aminocyclopropane-1-carboxylate deaminase/D-cysteine desulfhydrase-like pyridoxal-dependent ACC family enzyme
MKALAELNKIDLALKPTPLYKLNNISRITGKNIYIKRDDMTGIGLGGNKVRKLEYVLSDAIACGADTIITTGAAQSNHAMLTAACCRKLGLDVILVLMQRGVTENTDSIYLIIQGMGTPFLPRAATRPSTCWRKMRDCSLIRSTRERLSAAFWT